jgi:hypothetical protein
MDVCMCPLFTPYRGKWVISGGGSPKGSPLGKEII